MGFFKHGLDHGKVCPATGKLSYATHHEANLALKALARRVKPFPSRIRHYLQSKKGPCDAFSCASCNGWHLGRPGRRERGEKRAKRNQTPENSENE